MEAKTFKNKYPDAFEREHNEWSYHCEPEYEYVVEDFVARMKLLGVDIDESTVCWSGFCSQGDGASFTAWVEPGKAFFDANEELWDDYGVIAGLVDTSNLMEVIIIERAVGSYYHSNTMYADDSAFQDSFDIEWQRDHMVVGEQVGIDNGIYKGMPLEVALSLFPEQEIDIFTDTVLEICKSYANDLYEELEAAYEYEIGEERFMEWLDDMGFDYDPEMEELNVH